VRVRSDEEEDQPGDSPEREAERRRPVAVASGERTRRQRSEQLQERRRDQPRQRVRRNDGGEMRQPPGDQLAEEACKRCRDERRRHCHDEEGEAVGAELRREPALLLGPRQVGHDDHAKRLRTEHQHEVDAVGGHEPVRP
jgi:hypothetical protein